MEFQGVQRCCQRCQCHYYKDTIRYLNSKPGVINMSNNKKRIAAGIQAEEEIIIHDTVNIETAKNKGVVDINQTKLVCFHGEELLKEVSRFLKNFEELDENVWSTICEHCRKIKSTHQCKKCNYLFTKISKGKEKRQDTQKWKEIKDLLNQIKLFLETLTINKRSKIASDYEDLVKMLKCMQIPSESRVVVKELSEVGVLKYKNTDKYLDNLKEECPITSNISSIRKKVDLKSVPCKETHRINTEVSGDIRNKGKKSDKIKTYTSSNLFMKMILKERKNRRRSGAGDQGLHDLIKSHEFEGLSRPKIDELPALPVRILEEKNAEEFESFLECKESRFSEPKEIIQVNKIITQKQNNKKLRQEHKYNRKPLFYEVQHNFSYTNVQHTKETSNNNDEYILNDNTQERTKQMSSHIKGPTKYQLSNRRYIEDGLTVLPVLKIKRRVNMYKMITSLPKYDWLEKYKCQGLMYYASGEKLTEISDEGRVRWYYRDGGLALDFHNSKGVKGNFPEGNQKLNSTHNVRINYQKLSNQQNVEGSSAPDEFLIYDSFELRKKCSQPENKIILAHFDKMGNGIVYDRKGRIRLKYNQCEGINLDKEIGPTGRWKWNNLNDPPELQQVFEEKHSDEIDNCLKNFEKEQNETQPNIIENEMRTIELQNYVNQRFKKMFLNYKPYEIIFKVLRLNEKFTLRILDQTKIYLLFKDGQNCLKLNLGMQLISNEIIDLKTVDFDDVVTPYDH